MDKRYQLPRSHLFTVRMWEEEVSSGQSEWRGKVQLVSSGDVRYFRHWSALAPLLITMLSEVRPPVGLLHERYAQGRNETVMSVRASFLEEEEHSRTW